MENWAEPKTAVLRHFLKTNINTETTDSQNINCNKSRAVLDRDHDRDLS